MENQKKKKMKNNFTKEEMVVLRGLIKKESSKKASYVLSLDGCFETYMEVGRAWRHVKYPF